MLEKPLLLRDNISKSPRLTSFLFHEKKKQTVLHPVNANHDGKAPQFGSDRECASRCTAIHIQFTPTPNSTHSSSKPTVDNSKNFDKAITITSVSTVHMHTFLLLLLV